MSSVTDIIEIAREFAARHGAGPAAMLDRRSIQNASGWGQRRCCIVGKSSMRDTGARPLCTEIRSLRRLWREVSECPPRNTTRPQSINHCEDW
jgi:hypothetical protein